MKELEIKIQSYFDMLPSADKFDGHYYKKEFEHQGRTYQVTFYKVREEAGYFWIYNPFFVQSVFSH